MADTPLTVRSPAMDDGTVTIVETHRAHIQQKLGMSSRAQLVRYALDNDLIER
jgi:FixJ family two-component response regulator